MDLDHSILTNFELDPISVGSSQLGLKWMSWEESFLFMSGQKQRINIGFRKEGTGYFSRQKLTSFKMRVGLVKQNYEEGSLTVTFSRASRCIELHISIQQIIFLFHFHFFRHSFRTTLCRLVFSLESLQFSYQRSARIGLNHIFKVFNPLINSGAVIS